MVVSMLRKESNPSVQIKRVAMDNDTTMSCELRKEIERHTLDLKNNLGSHLEVSQKTHKALTWKVIIYLQKCLLTQNKHRDSTNDWRG